MAGTAPVSRAYLAATRPLAEILVGRRLRRAEQIIDVFHLIRLLDDAKDDVDRAVTAEQRRAITAGLAAGRRIQLQLTGAMVAPLDRLYRAGRAEATTELERLGITPARAYATDPHDPVRPDQLDRLIRTIEAQLGGLSIRVESQRVQLQLAEGGPVGKALADALLRVLGARSIAAGVVSSALFSGMGATFEENQDLIGGFEYTAVLDGGTCDECEPLDGTEYESWDAIQEVLPDGGPNPACLGGGRCRCRAVPTFAA